MCLVTICTTPNWGTVVSEGRVLAAFEDGRKLIASENQSKFVVLRDNLALTAVGIEDVILAINQEVQRKVDQGLDFSELVQETGTIAAALFRQRAPVITPTPGDDSINLALVGV